MPSLEIDVRARLAQFNDSLDKVGRDASRTAQRIDSAFSGLRGTLAGLGVGLSVAGLVSFAKAGIDAADQLQKLSQRVGLSVEGLSALKYAGDLADVSLEQLGTGLRMLSKNMADMQAGTGEAQQAFKALGISVEATKGVLKGGEQVLFEIADQFAGMEDGAGKTALAMKLFGRAGADLIPLLNQGAAGLRANAEEAKRFGLIISGETARAAEEFNDNMTRLGKSVDALKFSLAENILPTLSTFAERLLIARQAGDGLLDVMRLITVNTGATGGNIVAELAGVRAELDAMQKKREELANPAKSRIRSLFGSDDLKLLDAQIAAAHKKVKFLQELGAKVLRGNDVNDEGAGVIKKRAAPALPGDSKTPKLIDAKEVERAEQIMSKFRDKVRGMQDEISRTEGIDSALVSMRRLLEVDKELRDLHSEDKAALLDQAQLVDLVKAEAHWKEEMAEATRVAQEEGQKWRHAELEAVNAIKDQIDPMRERNREIQRLAELYRAGRISAEEFNKAAADPKVRELLDILNKKNPFAMSNDEIGDIGLDKYLEAARKVNGALAGTSTMAQGLDHAFQSAFENATVEGEKFRDVVKALSKDLARLLIRENITSPLAKGISGILTNIKLPSFDVGTDFVPRDMIAMVHKGERIVPAAENRGGGSGDTIIFNQTNNFGSDVSHGTLAQWARRVKQDTITAVVDARKRNIIPA